MVTSEDDLTVPFSNVMGTKGFSESEMRSDIMADACRNINNSIFVSKMCSLVDFKSSRTSSKFLALE